MSNELKGDPDKKELVQQVLKYSDGTETIINYNSLGEKIAEGAAVEPEEVPAGDSEAKDEADIDDAEVYDGPMGVYKITGDAYYTDEDGVKTGTLEIGSIHKMPVPVGQVFVDEGVAEEVEAGPQEALPSAEA